MTNEQRKAIELAKEFTEMDFSNPMGWSGYYDTDLKELSKAIDTVLSLIKKQQEEIEKKDKIIDFYKKGLEREVESNRENVMEIIKKDKQIDYIIDFIRERSIYAVDTHEKLKQYFADLVEKE